VVAEPKVVVAHREHLWWLLAEAAQLEHMIMCGYLFAEFSFKDGIEDGLTPEQTEAVDRWRGVLHGIAVEEMLHFTLVANLMLAIGAAPTIGRPNFPQRSGYFPAGLQLDLLPFGDEALRHFLYLERPEGMERQDADGFVPVAPPRVPVAPDELLPRGQEFATVGHLYRGIADGLRALAADIGEAAVFVGSPGAQATADRLHWPQVVGVTDLASALRAVEEIIEQGEGARGDWQQAHYGRFLAMWTEYHEMRQRDPGFEPARPVLPAYTRQPFDIPNADLPVITDPAAHRVAELAGLAYEVVLHLLLRFFTHTEETEEQLGVLIGSAIDVMAGALRPLAKAMTTLPVGSAFPGRTAGFTFEMYYTMSNLAPARTAAWALLHERAALLRTRCHEAAELSDAVRTAGETAGKVADALAAHTPVGLLPVTG
jgi:hypothetical protein